MRSIRNGPSSRVVGHHFAMACWPRPPGALVAANGSTDGQRVLRLVHYRSSGGQRVSRRTVISAGSHPGGLGDHRASGCDRRRARGCGRAVVPAGRPSHTLAATRAPDGRSVRAGGRDDAGSRRVAFARSGSGKMRAKGLRVASIVAGPPVDRHTTGAARSERRPSDPMNRRGDRQPRPVHTFFRATCVAARPRVVSSGGGSNRRPRN